MTLKEIAQQANVSVSTVSRIINSPDNSFARKEVRDRVWKIIRETGYSPNPVARELKSGRTKESGEKHGTLAIVLGRTLTLDENPFFSEVSRFIEHISMEMNYPVGLIYSVYDIASPQMLEKIRSISAEGAIVIGRLSQSTSEALDSQYKNIIYVGRNEIRTDWDQIICDGYDAARIGLNYLRECGHSRVGYFGEIKNEVRHRAFLDFTKEEGLFGCPVIECKQSGEAGYSAAEKLLASEDALPAAILCAADIIAISAMKKFKEARIKIPEQLSIMGMDNIELSGYVSPMLTTVGMPIAEMGELAVKTLLDRIMGGHKLSMKIVLPNRLIKRSSVLDVKEGFYKGMYI